MAKVVAVAPSTPTKISASPPANFAGTSSLDATLSRLACIAVTRSASPLSGSPTTKTGVAEQAHLA
ncbi:hypothetical protein DFQ27_009693, partial [Actinomortierella ambigua]